MLQSEIKNCFIELGKFLSQFELDNNEQNNDVKNNDLFYDSFVFERCFIKINQNSKSMP